MLNQRSGLSSPTLLTLFGLGRGVAFGDRHVYVADHKMQLDELSTVMIDNFSLLDLKFMLSALLRTKKSYFIFNRNPDQLGHIVPRTF
jgi:hypothetical protein